jgi:hypothetical protein
LSGPRVAAARDRRGLKTEADGELDGEMTQATDPDDRDAITTASSTGPQRLEARDACAPQRSRILIGEVVGRRGQRRGFPNLTTSRHHAARDGRVLTSALGRRSS